MPSKDNHISSSDLKRRHQPKSGGAGKKKGCLTRHQRRTENHHCSHQWQAYEKAQKDLSIYNYPAYASLCNRAFFKTDARKTDKGIFPYDYADFELKGDFWKSGPTHEGKEWDFGKTSTVGKSKKENFKHFIAPYWHNAHHIVPNGALKKSIDKTGSTDGRLPGLIRYGLLLGEYNLNDKVNMIILPQGSAVAAALKLPRHLKGDKVGPGEQEELYSHVDYSNVIETRLDSVMNLYRDNLADCYNKSHPEPPKALAKSKIEDISKEVYDAIIAIPNSLAGKALSNVTHLFAGK